MGSDKDSGNSSNMYNNNTNNTTNNDVIQQQQQQQQQLLDNVTTSTTSTASTRGRSTISRSSTANNNMTNSNTLSSTTGTTTSSNINNNSNNTISGLHHRRITRSTSNDGMIMDDHERGYGGGGGGNTSSVSNTFQQKYNTGKNQQRNTSHRQQQQLTGGGRRNPNNNNNSHYNNNNSTTMNHNNRIVFGQWARTCVLAGIPAYLVLLVLFLHRMNQQSQMQYYSDNDSNNTNNVQQQQLHSMLHGTMNIMNHNRKKLYVNPQHYYSIDTPYIKQLYQQSKMDRTTLREQYDKDDMNMILSQQTLIDQRMKLLRRTRTIPPPIQPKQQLQQELFPPTKILSIVEYERPISQQYINYNDNIRPGLIKPATVDAICGIHAKKVVEEDSIEIPETIARSYTTRDTLVMPKDRTTRVLITGILNPIGYMLAIALKQHCNVDVIIGFDHMYPNSIKNRLQLQNQIAVLTKFIPKLVRPIFLAHIGLDPLRHGKMFKTLYDTGELDIVTSLTPTHIVHFASYDPSIYRYNHDPDWKNIQHPYVRDRRISIVIDTSTGSTSKSKSDTNSNIGDANDDVDAELSILEEEEEEAKEQHVLYQQVHTYNTALYGLRNGMLSMEQILASIAAAPINERPHFIYASSSSIMSNTKKSLLQKKKKSQLYENIMHIVGRQIDEVLADYYYLHHGITSTGLRLPNTIYGPYNHPESDLYQLIDHSIRNLSIEKTSDTSNNTNVVVHDAMIVDPVLEHALKHPDNDSLDLVHVNDVVDATIAAMQYRAPDGKAELFDLQSGETMSLRTIQDTILEILDPSSTSINSLTTITDEMETEEFVQNRNKLHRAIYWKPSIPLKEGLVRTVAWHMDRIHPYGAPLHLSFNITPSYIVEPGDSILQRHKVPTCPANDYLCHGSKPHLPCASECSTQQQCIPTVFDELIPMVNDLTEACDIVLLTHNFDSNASDLSLQAEYIENAKPQICNFAFVRGDTLLVEDVIKKVPESELGRLGVDVSPDDNSDTIKARKLDRLNGRLLYRGWILIWTNDAPETLSKAENFLLKLSPGKFFHPDVKSAVFIDQGFGVSPTADDVLFLVHEMNREPRKARIIKRKNRPKAKFLIPSEPQRKAVILMSELKYQDSKEAERLAPQETISTYEATRFMRYSIGEEPLGKEPPEIKLQREFYDRVRASINPDHARGPSPLHKFELNHWVRSRWVAHDMVHEESRQLRCDWYREHVFWESDLDQLSFAYVMQKLELNRKLEHNEIDETAQKQIQEKTEMKKLLSDTFEWHALALPQNKLYSPYEEMQILPFDMDNTEERELLHKVADVREDGPDMPLYVRIISDRIMAYARKAWSNSKGTDEGDASKNEL